MSFSRKPITSSNQRTIRVSGGFKVGASGAVGDQYGAGFVVTTTGTGAYTITFTDYYPSLISMSGSVQAATAGNKVVQFVAFTAASRTLTFKTLTNGSAADQAQNDYVWFDVELKASTV